MSDRVWGSSALPTGVAPSTKTAAVESVFTWGVFAYVILRAVPVWRGLEEGNVNPWIFIALDVVTAWPYAKSWPRLFQALRAKQHDRVVAWSLVLLGSLLTPYLYVAVVGDGVAAWVWVVLAVFLAIALGSAAFRLKKAASAKTERNLCRHPVPPR